MTDFLPLTFLGTERVPANAHLRDAIYDLSKRRMMRLLWSDVRPLQSK